MLDFYLNIQNIKKDGEFFYINNNVEFSAYSSAIINDNQSLSPLAPMSPKFYKKTYT